MIIGVEPFGHFQCGLCGVASRQRKILLGLDLRGVKSETRRNRAQQHRVIQHLIVQAKVADADVIQSGGFLRQPMLTAQLFRNLLQFGER